jgi:phosphatidylglycerophosphatase A
MNRARRNDLVMFLATGCFTGFLPRAPGTWGTFAAVPLVMLLHHGGATAQMLTASVFILAAAWISARAESLLGSRDPGVVVIDEMSGLVVSLLCIPLSPISLCSGFVAFRLFDIVKPPPIRGLEKRLQGGWGIVLDDVLAGIYANVSVRCLLFSLSVEG